LKKEKEKISLGHCLLIVILWSCTNYWNYSMLDEMMFILQIIVENLDMNSKPSEEGLMFLLLMVCK